ncbi:hypothetical protein FH972_011678 [Carpinus fangiana]|uniref:Pentatricopeptide repeat-containing protein n=1 Tax=Carpinus fangiana TaxID=176857 RepID=A0A660KU61_9ROSI|nr:hypothetical protein FH972_011678 [Carpinus fangiana]
MQAPELGVNLTLRNAMLDTYWKCGGIEDAKRLFDKMLEKDEARRRVFDAMPCQDIAVWNALISAYEQNGKPKEALAIFRNSLKHETVTG